MGEENFASGYFMTTGSGEAVGHWTMYRWIPIAGSLTMFAWACMIGANDVATSFGTSVGSGALTALQAVLLAILMETTGAVFGRGRVVDHQATQVINEGPPTEALLMCALLISLIAATIWLTLATYWGLPVTSSLTLWGALIGVSLTTQGFDGVYWIKQDSPFFLGGVLGILVSWFLAPLVAGIMAFLFFGSMKLILLRAQDAERRAVRALPIYYGITVTVLIFFIIYEATPGPTLEDLDKQRSALIAVFSGLLSVILAYMIVIPLLQKRLCLEVEEQSLASQMKSCPEKEEDTKSEELSSPTAKREMSAEDYLQQYNERRCLETVPEGDEEACQSGQFRSMQSIKCSPLAEGISFAQLLARTPSRVFTFQQLRTLSRGHSFQTKGHKTIGLVAFQQVGGEVIPSSRIGTAVIVHPNNCLYGGVGENMEHDARTRVMHTRAEKFDSRVEELFDFLCILTACVTAFSHGFNEVAAAVGPYSQIIHIYEHGKSRADQDTEVMQDGSEGWNCGFAALGVSIGFGMLGWKLVRCLGGRLVFLSPSRAFSAQLCTLATVLLASQQHIPYSTTHILIGALVGVGLSDNIRNVNWNLLSLFFVGWGATLLLTSGLSCALFSFTIFSPAYSLVQK